MTLEGFVGGLIAGVEAEFGFLEEGEKAGSSQAVELGVAGRSATYESGERLTFNLIAQVKGVTL